MPRHKLRIAAGRPLPHLACSLLCRSSSSPRSSSLSGHPTPPPDTLQPLSALTDRSGARVATAVGRTRFVQRIGSRIRFVQRFLQ